MSARSVVNKGEAGRVNAEEVYDIKPQADAREVLQRAAGTPAGSTMS